jgi:4-coumarate--CoA ligase
MPFKGPYEIDIPSCNLLKYHIPQDEELPDEPLWIDAVDTSISLSLRQMNQWVKRLAIGLDRLGVKPGEVVLMYSPNHIFVGVAYFGITGSGRIFSGANPIYTVPGKLTFPAQPSMCLLT